MPSSSQLPESEYLKTAFFLPANLWFLWITGLSPVMFLFATHQFTPWPWLLGIGLESLYMATVPTNERFRRWVRSIKYKVKTKEVSFDEAKTIEHLDPSLQKRVYAVNAIVQKIKSTVQPINTSENIFLEENLAKVESLRTNYIRLTATLQNYYEYMQTVNRKGIESDLQRLEDSILNSSEKIKQIREKNAEVLQQRIKKIDSAEENRDYIIAQLETIEDTLQLARDQSMTMANNKNLSLQIDNVLNGLADTTAMAEEMQNLIELSDIQGIFESTPSIDAISSTSNKPINRTKT